MDSIQLLGMARDLRDAKKFQCGEPIKSHEPRFFLGGAANPFAGPDVRARAARLGKKVANGADFVQTQIIYNVEKFADFMEMVRDLGLDEKVYILAGVTPPRSLGMARYMKSSVPGMDVTDEVINRLQSARDKEEEGIDICVEVINRVREIKGVAGVHIMAIEWESAVPEIVKRAKLGERPQFDDDLAAPMVSTGKIEREEIVIREAAPAADTSEVMAAAKKEAELIVARAREEAARLQAQTRTTGSVVAAAAVREHIEIDDAGEHEMNEKERLLALESLKFGLEALKKSLGLSDEQFEALIKFASAEAILKREPPQSAGAIAKPAAPPAPVAAPPAPAVAAKPAAPVAAPVSAAPAPAATKPAAKIDIEAIKAAAAAKKADAPKVEAKAAAEAKPVSAAKPVESKPAPAAAPATPAAAPAAAPASAGALAVETTPLASRASKVPADHYTVNYSGKIRETSLGNGDQLVKVGGETVMPFQLYEGAMPNRPLIAMDVLDAKPEEWPDSLARHFAGVMDNPVEWAKKCVNDYQAEAICLSLVSTDPNGLNKPAAEAAKVAAEVIKNIEVPIILWGCGNADKDTETLREITAMVGDKKVCLAPLSDANYRSIGATAMAFQHSMVAASPIDVNLAKQLNILLENLGVSLDTVLIDPSIGALGYGIEYTYSVMERIRLAAMTQKDEKLQVPFVCNLGREVWKTKETRLPSDAMLGDQERRGVLLEAITASCLLMAGGEVLIMRHPQAVSLTRAMIDGLLG
jgi:CO dehydrogenase/acetyl-CoA synthase delta subunit